MKLSNITNQGIYVLFQKDGSEIVVEGPRCSLRTRKVLLLDPLIASPMVVSIKSFTCKIYYNLEKGK